MNSGSLKPDAKGTLKYDSLLKYLAHLKEKQKNFADVWRTHATKEGIYFRTYNLLFRWNPQSRQIKVWEEHKYRFNASFLCGGRLFIHKRQVGLLHMEDDLLEMLPGGESLAGMKIYMLVRYDTHKLLIGTRSQGFYIFDMKTTEKTLFPTGADNYLKEKQLYQGIRLSSSPGKIALATLDGGLVIMDSRGKLKEIFNEEYGLQTEEVNYVFEDSLGDLWLGLNRGISKIEYISPLSVCDYRSNLPMMIFSVVKHQKYLYVGTSKGLYFLAGYDKDWSSFTSITQKEYTNLDSGLYTFRVRARNVYEKFSREDVFQFKILLPWYRTWWAFSIYASAAFILILLIVKWRSWKLVKEKHRLEKIIEERTKEINEKNQKLQVQTHQLKEQSEKLQEMDRMKSRFFANISHEFRTPLTLIMGPMEQMISTSDDKEQKRQLNLMFQSSQRLLALINQLLDLAKFDSGKMKLQAGYQNIIPFLRGILASFELLAQQYQLELQLIAAEENITLYFDPGKIEQVMCNLLINAVKFTPAQGKITVEVKNIHTKEVDILFPGGFLEISVRDTGVGIPKEQLDHIFDRFYQAESSSGHSWEQGHEGTGIGLALAKELVELHHGSINVFSEGGKGTGFIIRLPLGKEHLSADQVVDTSEAPLHLKKTSEITASYMMGKKDREPITGDVEENGLLGKSTGEEYESRDKFVILVVDDSPGIREYIRKALEPTYTVAEAVNGREGIRKAKDIIPDLIISDIMMPGIDGYELCNTLKNEIETCHIPIILLTAKASEENIIQGLETGADDYITKPFNTKILCARIKNLIELRRQLQMKIQRQKEFLPDEIAVSSIDETFLNEFQDIIEKNLSDPGLNIHQLSKKLYMGRTTLFRKIEALTGQTPNQFIQSYRLQRAVQLLKANFGNITQVAFEVGFSSSAYFTKCFKEKFHQLPSTFLASESASPGSDKSPGTIH